MLQPKTLMTEDDKESEEEGRKKERKYEEIVRRKMIWKNGWSQKNTRNAEIIK